MSYLAGIDFSTRSVDVVTVDEDTGAATWTTYPLSGADAFERTRNVADAIPGRHSVFWDDVVAVAIEEPQGAQKATVAKLKAIQGAVLACLPAQLLVHQLRPSEWRKAVGLPGNASKADVMRWALQDIVGPTVTVLYPPYDVEFSQDACDAYCLALAVGTLVETAEKT